MPLAGEKQLRTWLAALMLVLAILPAEAETAVFGSFRVSPETPEVMVLVGPIQPNAPLDLKRALRAFPGVATLALHSEGGDLVAGLLVAQELAERGISTYVAVDSYCYSACAYVFFAGSDREVQGKLGVHQMTNDAQDPYSVQVALSDMLDTLTDFDVPPSVVSEMLRTAPDDMRIYSAREAAALGLNRVASEEATAAASATEQISDLPAQDTTSVSLSTAAEALFLVANGGSGAVPQRGTVWWSTLADENGIPT